MCQVLKVFDVLQKRPKPKQKNKNNTHTHTHKNKTKQKKNNQPTNQKKTAKEPGSSVD